MSSSYKDQLDHMVFSFSRVNSYSQCPYGWKLHYIDHLQQEGSGFADWGSLCHSIFEDYAKGKLADFELYEAYEERYPQYMKNDFPPARGMSLAERYYERGQDLFSHFIGFPENWEILGVEQEVAFEFSDYQFIGYIDLLVRDKNDGKLIVVDHKSKSAFKNSTEQAHYALQLYLYAYWVHLTYGEYPKSLLFNMFRVEKEVEIPFDEEEMKKALEWFVSTIQKIYEDEDFWDKIALEYEKSGKLLSAYRHDDYFCNALCGSRRYCPRSKFYQNEYWRTLA